MMQIKAKRLRSNQFYSSNTMISVIRNGHMHSLGLPEGALRSGKPVIGIANSASDLAPCNAHLSDIAESVKRGVLDAGGIPLVFPTISLGETNMAPTTMLFRNLMSMDVEEMIRASPIDGVVLLGGCDKTAPAQLMGAASVDIPTLVVTGGPMLTSRFRGKPLGTGTTASKMADQVRTGEITPNEFFATEVCYARSAGHCAVMGTASTMGSTIEALGMQLPGTSSIPAPETGRRLAGHEAGRRIVEMVAEDLRPSAIMTRAAFENAIKVSAALNGSTNAVLHLLAIAGRVGVELSLDDFDRWSRDIPLLANLQPTGTYFMEDFHHAGGLPALMARLTDHLHLDAITVSGGTVGENLASAECYDDDVIRTVETALGTGFGTAVLRGNLAPQGAVIKQATASESLMVHRGRAVVFDSIRECQLHIDDIDLDIDATSVLVVRNAGPAGYPGMPEVGKLPIPRKLLAAGVTDMVRISDARISGTSFGTVIVHVAPEAAKGGPIALVRTGDIIRLDVPNRSLSLEVDESELEVRRALLARDEVRFQRGYARLYVDHVLQADRGADFDFLVGSSGSDFTGGDPHLPPDENELLRPAFSAAETTA
ncbi:dihydroxy-acid dehydratase [Salinibacterium sp. G-O1]|uniref:dihydroxy-acid dehydratase n=1 Tax=Salinibacterium sp. G-O1 TaxID=3046208 RepID=UPI0024B9AFA4|nr:dihydroxy-acid dehydratase [Salinibacterium sp. G-O1]MDJ0334926.1 dihydroxy-acid dehydratase [Salinibacterium sp. G-O1]